MSWPYRKAFKIVKSIIPKISETEIIALKSGGVSIDRELFNGKVDYKDECIHYLMNELDYKMNLIIENYPFPALKPLLYPLKNKIQYSNLEAKNKLYTLIINNEQLHNIFKNDIYYEGTILEKMEKLRKMKPESEEYKQLYQDIIQVGEYKIQ